MDDVFPWSHNIMKPFPQRKRNDRKPISGYRLSYFHRISENALGILAGRFRLFFRLSNLTSKVAVDAILAAVILQNLFRCKSRESYTPPDFVDELDEGQVIHERYWRQNNTHTNIAIAHSHKQNNSYPKMLRLLVEFWMINLWTWSSFKAMGYISLMFGIIKMYLLSVKVLCSMTWCY